MPRTYAGPYRNPTEGWTIEFNGKAETYYIAIDGRPHTSGIEFDDADEAYEYISETHYHFEQDYDNYLDENHSEISRMEAYEDFRNEY